MGRNNRNPFYRWDVTRFENILVVKLKHIGDTLMATPLFSVLK